MSNQIYTIQELIDIITPIMRKYHAEQGILFGSYSRNSADSSSDIDLVIVGGANFILTDVFAIAEDLHRATGKDVDVYEKCEINEGTDFYNTIMNEGVRIAA